MTAAMALMLAGCLGLACDGNNAGATDQLGMLQEYSPGKAVNGEVQSSTDHYSSDCTGTERAIKWWFVTNRVSVSYCSARRRSGRGQRHRRPEDPGADAPLYSSNQVCGAGHVAS